MHSASAAVRAISAAQSATAHGSARGGSTQGDSGNPYVSTLLSFSGQTPREILELVDGRAADIADLGRDSHQGSNASTRGARSSTRRSRPGRTVKTER